MPIRKIKHFFVFSVFVGVIHLAVLIMFAKNKKSAADVEKSGPLQDENTIVTAVFACNIGVYHGINQTAWVKNILSLQDSMIIYTSPDLMRMIRFLRSHASQKTVIVSMNLSDVVNLTRYISTDNVAVEARQLQLFRMQLSRTFFVQKAILTNPFNSQNFMWSDSDCFRDNSVVDIFNNYVGKKLIYHAEMIPQSAILMMSTFVSKTREPYLLDNEKSHADSVIIGSGKQIAAHYTTWPSFHLEFLKQMATYNQTVLWDDFESRILQETCNQQNVSCVFCTPDMVHGNPRIGLREILHTRGCYMLLFCTIFFRDAPLLLWVPHKQTQAYHVSNTTNYKDKVHDVCIAFLSCKRLEKLKKTYEAVTSLIRSEPTLSFKIVIADNDSGVETTQWIKNNKFDKTFFYSVNVGIAKAMDVLWDECEDSRYILNIEDDWVYTNKNGHSMIQYSIEILEKHEDVVEVWLRTNPDNMQYEPNSTISINGEMIREWPSVVFNKTSYYLQKSTKKTFPWWGSYTNGASLKHTTRLKSIGKMYQDHCAENGNCESEFAARVSYRGWKVVRFCWQGDDCNTTSNNEPDEKVMFTHLLGERSTGHRHSTTVLDLVKYFFTEMRIPSCRIINHVLRCHLSRTV